MIAKLTAKDDKYASDVAERIISESQDTDMVPKKVTLLCTSESL